LGVDKEGGRRVSEAGREIVRKSEESEWCMLELDLDAKGEREEVDFFKGCVVVTSIAIVPLALLSF
jgi:hypothetical protein